MVDLKAGIVRILDRNSATVGTGFLVTGRHVVTGALGLPHGIPNPPQADLHLDFPVPGLKGISASSAHLSQMKVKGALR